MKSFTIKFTDAQLDVIRSTLSITVDSGEEDERRSAVMERVIGKIDQARSDSKAGG